MVLPSTGVISAFSKVFHSPLATISDCIELLVLISLGPKEVFRTNHVNTYMYK